MVVAFVFFCHLSNMFGFMPPPDPPIYLSEKWRVCLRVGGFLLSVALIAAYGKELEMPESALVLASGPAPS